MEHKNRSSATIAVLVNTLKENELINIKIKSPCALMREGFFCERSNPRAQSTPTPSTKSVRADTSEPTRQSRAVRTSRPDHPDPMKAQKRHYQSARQRKHSPRSAEEKRHIPTTSKRGRGSAVRGARHTAKRSRQSRES